MTAFDAGCRTLLIVVFAVAVAGKLRTRSAFVQFVATLVPLGGGRQRTRLLATGLVLAEVATVATLVIAPVAGYPLAVAVLVALCVGVAVVLRRGLAVSCACFGASTDGALTSGHLVRNLLLTGVAVAGFAAHLRDAGGLDPAVVGTAVVAGAVAGWCMTRWDDLAALLRP